ncbi:MAG: hypothetical protein ACJ786_01550 [Catenulispora sp.]
MLEVDTQVGTLDTGGDHIDELHIEQLEDLAQQMQQRLIGAAVDRLLDRLDRLLEVQVLLPLTGIQRVEPPGHLAYPPVRELFPGPRILHQAISGIITGTSGSVPLLRLPIGGISAGVALLSADPPRPGPHFALPRGALAVSICRLLIIRVCWVVHLSPRWL